MNLEETKTLLTIISAMYPNSREFSPESFELQAKLWQRIFTNVSFKDLGTAFEIWVSVEKFPPTTADLNQIVKKLQNPPLFVSGLSAWDIVHVAVRRYGWANEEKALNSFDERTKKAIRAVGGWQRICATPDGKDWDFLRKNFIDNFDEFGRHDLEKALLPDSTLKKMQEQLEQRKLAKTLEQPNE